MKIKKKFYNTHCITPEPLEKITYVYYGKLVAENKLEFRRKVKFGDSIYFLLDKNRVNKIDGSFGVPIPMKELKTKIYYDEPCETIGRMLDKNI